LRALVLISGLAPGGAERVTVSLLTRLRATGRAAPLCTVTSRHDGPLAAEATAAGLERRDLGARRLADPLALARLVGLLRAERFDLVHAHGQDAALLAAAATGVVRVRLVITRHVLDEPDSDWRERARARLTLQAFRRADVAVAVSRAAAERLAHLAHLSPSRIRVVPNGIDVAAFARVASGPARARLLADLGLPRDVRIVLCPAVLRKGKGHRVLLDALPELRRRCPGVRVLLAGGGELEAELRRSAEPHGEAIHFLGHRTDMPELMAASDLVVLPSRAEALPTVLMEAAAAGRPAVASRVGGVPEIVDHGTTGLLVPPGDPGALARATADLLSTPQRAGQMGERARRRARSRFSLDRQAEDTLALWDHALQRRAS
jgi:glycosyltransferase involved in cell wall biosynthesis